MEGTIAAYNVSGEPGKVRLVALETEVRSYYCRQPWPRVMQTLSHLDSELSKCCYQGRSHVQAAADEKQQQRRGDDNPQQVAQHGVKSRSSRVT